MREIISINGKLFFSLVFFSRVVLSSPFGRFSILALTAILPLLDDLLRDHYCSPYLVVDVD